MAWSRRRLRVNASGPGSIASASSIANACTHIGDIHYHHGLDQVPLAVAALDYRLVQADASVDHFTGRAWLAGQIEALLDAGSEPDGRGSYVLVGGQAGVGKTAVAAWLSRRWGCVCHFTCAPGGRSARVALQSLAAQLISRHGLEADFAPAGMLAPWAGDPAHFPMILAAAAERARADGKRIRIVVDGLDEADGEGPPLGLPHVLPAGVEMIATHRDGILPGRLPSGDHVAAVTIDAADPDNLNDIRCFLAARAREEPIAARLAAAGVCESDFVAMLTDKCGGVWVYLRYVLAQMRVGPWGPADLDRLPLGLVSYYRQHVTGRRSDPVFHSQDLAVLGALAVAEQPLTVGQIAQFTSLDRGIVRRLCNHRYLPFLNVAATNPPKYSIHHASLRDFLRGEPRSHDTQTGTVETGDLREATRVAHGQIARHYLMVFGGLAGNLPALRDDQTLASMDDCYPLRYLPWHLDQAGRHEDLHTLLTCCPPASDTPLGTVWADVHDRAGTLDDYLAQIELARRTAEQCTDAQIAVAQTAPTLGTETAYALLTANVVSRSSAIPAGILLALLRSGTWDAARVVFHASRQQDPYRRANALVTLLPDLTNPAQATYARQSVLTAVPTIGYEEWQAELLVALAPGLDNAQLDRALAIANSIRDEWFRARVIESLAGYLEAAQLGRALDAAITITDEQARARALARLAPHLGQAGQASALDQALDAAAGRKDGLGADILAVVAAHLDAAQLDRALELSACVGDERSTMQMLAQLAQYLNPCRRLRALELAAAIEDADLRTSALVAVAAYMDSAAKGRGFDMALDAFAECKEGELGARTLEDMAGHLDVAQLDRALEISASIPKDWHLEKTLIALAPSLGPGQLVRAVDIANSATWQWTRTSALVALVARMDGPAKTRTLDHVLDTIAATEHGCSEAITALCPHLTAAQLGRALEIAVNIPIQHGNWWDRSTALASIATHMNGPSGERALDQALDAAEATTRDDLMVAVLTEVAPHLNARQLARAVGIATANRDGRFQTRAFAVTAAYADRARLDQALDIAVTIENEYHKGQTLAAIAAHLGSESFGRALEGVAAIKDQRVRSITLDQLLPYLGTGQLDRALEIAADCGERALANAIVGLVDRLNPKQARRALEAASTIKDKELRAHALVVISGRVDDPVCTRVLKEAREAAVDQRYPYLRVRALIGMTARETGPARVRMLDQALDTLIGLTDDDQYSRLRTLADLAPHLDPSQLRRALDIAHSTEHAWYRAEAIVAVADYLDEPTRARELEQALDLAATTDEAEEGEGWEWQWLTLVKVGAHLDTDQQAQVLELLVTTTSPYQHRAFALGDIAPHLHKPLLSRALELVLALPPSGPMSALAAEAIFTRIRTLMEDMTLSELMRLIRQVHHALPQRELLLAVIATSAEIAARIGGEDAMERQLQAISNL